MPDDRAVRPGAALTPPASLVTAQDVFEHLMRGLVAPALHDLGFKGTGPRRFRCRRGDHEVTLSTQKSWYSTREEVDFWAHLTAAYLPTRSVYWTAQLHALILGNESFSFWTVRAGEPAEPVAEHLLGVFRAYGWPAVEATLDNPGYPPDPAAVWARTFPPDPGAVDPGLLNRLEHDPSPEPAPVGGTGRADAGRAAAGAANQGRITWAGTGRGPGAGTTRLISLGGGMGRGAGPVAAG